MSNVIIASNMFNATLERSNNDELFFPVSLQEFDVPYDASEDVILNATADNFRAVVREDTSEVLAVHGKDYNLVTNEELVGKFEDTLRRSDLDLTDMYTRTSVLDDGGAFVKSYHFPAHIVEPRVGDITELMIRLRGSYNSRYSKEFEQIANRLVCTNGQVSGFTYTKAFGRATSGFNVDKFVDKVSVSAEIFLKNADIWKEYANAKIMPMQVTAMLEALELPESFTRDIEVQFLKECDEAGHRTVFELFNALTNWASHGKLRAGTQRAVATENREKRVRSIITSAPFLSLVA